MRRLCCSVKNSSSCSSAINLSDSIHPRSHDNLTFVFHVDRVSFRSIPLPAFKCRSYDPKVTNGLDFRLHRFYWKRKIFYADAMDEDSFGFSSFSDWDSNDAATDYMFSSSDGDDNDDDITLQSITDVDLPTTKEHFRPADESITITAHRFAVLGRTQRKRKTIYGLLNNVGIAAFLIVLLLLVDCWAWKIVRLPLAPFYLLRPFLVSTVVVSFIGYIWVPLFRSLKHRSIVRKEGFVRHSYKKVTPTMGGLYFIPVGIVVAEAHVGFSCNELFGASAVTLAFAAIGLLSDLTSSMNKAKGYSSWTKIILEVAVTTWFVFWFCTTDICSPYSSKMVVPLPAPLGLVCCRGFYLFLTSTSFLSMADGVSLTDGLDGLAGGIAALAFTGMSIAVLPICADISVFGSSMAGACIGFLFQNRYKATIYMGDTGSLALGAALASMAACTGMFFPLLISSGLFVLEASSVTVQVSLSKMNKYFLKTDSRMLRMATVHHHLVRHGIKEPIIVAGAYFISSLLVLCAGYVGLISV